VKTVIKQKLIRAQIKVVKQAKLNQSNLKDTAKIKQYGTCLYSKLIGKEVHQDIEEEWAHIKKTIIVSADEVIQT